MSYITNIRWQLNFFHMIWFISFSFSTSIYFDSKCYSLQCMLKHNSERSFLKVFISFPIFHSVWFNAQHNILSNIIIDTKMLTAGFCVFGKSFSFFGFLCKINHHYMKMTHSLLFQIWYFLIWPYCSEGGGVVLVIVIKAFSTMIFLFLVYYFTSHSRIFRSYFDVAIARKRMQNSVILVYLAPTRF